MKEAMLYEKGEDKVARCSLCNHRCTIPPGKRGVCRVRENKDGTLHTLTHGRPVSMAVDPIEKKPLFHFHPASRVFSIATAGCNLSCSFCQNWTLSQADPGMLGERDVSPEKVAELVEQKGCAGIAYTYSEPTVFFEYALDIAKLVHEKGLYNVFVTNGYMTTDAIRTIAPYLDAANVDLKSISPAFYKERCGAPKGPDAVLASIREMVARNIHVEVTNLVIPDLNDSEEDLRGLCEAVVAIDPDIPVHFSRFHPDFKLCDREATPAGSLERASAIAKEAGLRYIYVGNIPGAQGESTFCPDCGELLIKRYGYLILTDVVSRTGTCPKCKAAINIIGEHHG